MWIYVPHKGNRVKKRYQMVETMTATKSEAWSNIYKKTIQIYKTGRDTDLQCLRQESWKFEGENYFSHWNPNALNYCSETDVPFRKELWTYIDKISSRRSLWNCHNILKLTKESEGIYHHIPICKSASLKKCIRAQYIYAVHFQFQWHIFLISWYNSANNNHEHRNQEFEVWLMFSASKRQTL